MTTSFLCGSNNLLFWQIFRGTILYSFYIYICKQACDENISFAPCALSNGRKQGWMLYGLARRPHDHEYRQMWSRPALARYCKENRKKNLWYLHHSFAYCFISIRDLLYIYIVLFHDIFTYLKKKEKLPVLSTVLSDVEWCQTGKGRVPVFKKYRYVNNVNKVTQFFFILHFKLHAKLVEKNVYHWWLHFNIFLFI